MLWTVRSDLERGLVAATILRLGEGNSGAGGGTAYKIAGLAIGSLGNSIAFAGWWRVTYQGVAQEFVPWLWIYGFPRAWCW